MLSRPKYLCIPREHEIENPFFSGKVPNGGPLENFSQKNAFSISVFSGKWGYFDLLNTKKFVIFRSGDFLGCNRSKYYIKSSILQLTLLFRICKHTYLKRVLSHLVGTNISLVLRHCDSHSWNNCINSIKTYIYTINIIITS